MAWPEAPEYTTALEHPNLCFSDPELLQGKPAVDEQGRPVTAAGTVSVVYKIVPDGKPPLAAKCYTRTIPNLAERYQALTAHLKPLNLPFLMDCQLLAQGIKVHAEWFPVLKMPWIEGQPLHRAVRDNLDKPRLFATLAELWLRIAPQLRKAQIAHGDLQHGNLLLVGGVRSGAVSLRLVDYDGMYVPALADKPPPAKEVGHPAYQHPQRRGGGYGPEMDRFPNLVLYTALRLLSLGGKTLWSRHDNGDNLLFRADDFANPAQSKLLRDTQQLKDTDLKVLAAHVFLASQVPLDQVPLLEEIIVNGKTKPLTEAQEAQVKKWLTPSAPRTATVPAKPAAPVTNGEAAPPIKVRCDGCKKTLSVKAHLAGKRLPCPVCKTPLVIPAPIAPPLEVAPPENLEEFAAAALFDDPRAKQQEAVEEARTIDFQCVWCDEELKFSIDLAGKQEPCPHCKRIVKVPVPKNHKPKDWRDTTQTGPSVARMNEPKLEGVMSSADKSRVHADSLEEAGALPETVEPVPVSTWVRRGFWTALILAILVGGYVLLTNSLAQNQQQQALDKALEAVEPKTKLKPLATAAIHRTAAEFYLRAQQADKAQDYFRKASRLPSTADQEMAKQAVERDAFLIDLILLWIDLAGTDEEEIDKVKIEWKKVQEDLGTTLLKISSVEARQTALREVGGKLKDRGKLEVALALAVRLSGNASEEGEGMATAQPQINILQAQYVAFLLQDNEKMAQEIVKVPKAGEPLNSLARQGYAEGWAWAGKFDDAMKLVKFGEEKDKQPLERFQAALGVAAVALLTKNPSHAQDLLDYAQKCRTELDKEETSIPAWNQLQLARMLAQVGKTSEARAVVEKMKDMSGKRQAQLELLRLTLAATKEQLPLTVAEDLTDKESLAFALGLVALARHDTRVGQQILVQEAIDGPEKRYRPFLYAGIALGLQDGRK